MSRINRANLMVLSGLVVAAVAGSAFAASDYAKTPLTVVSKYHHHDEDDDAEIPFAEAEIFFELNDTDGDLGIHALIDGEGWKTLRIEDPHERKMLIVWVTGRLRRQGLTEIFFESAEPTFDELDPHRFFRRFPEGEYEIEGQTLDWQELESEAELTHVMPSPPEPTVNGEPVAENCDDEDPDYAPAMVMDDEGVTIEWPPVTMSHPDADGAGAGIQPPVEVTIVNYEVVLEVEAENPDDEEDTYESIFSIKLPHWVNSVSIPEEYIDQGDTFKYEVLAREESYNQTAVESCFVLVE
jgi:hypothetical protein